MLNTLQNILNNIIQLFNVSNVYAAGTILQTSSGTVPLRTLYVDAAAGNDANAGSAAAPWLTLQKAANTVVAGDLVIVRVGTYAGFNMTRDGTATDRITFLADLAAAPGTVLINSRGPVRADGINLEGADYVTIDGFTFRAGDGTITGAAIRAATNTGIIIRNNNIDGVGAFWGWGIFTGHSLNVVIENNKAGNSFHEHGIYVSNADSDNPIVRGNIVWGNSGNGLHFNGDLSQGGDGMISNALVEGNIIFDNGAGRPGSRKAGGSAINMDGVKDSIVRNNLLYNNHASGISLYNIDSAAGSTNNLVANNTIVMASNGRWALNIQDASTGNTVFNNILYNNSGNGSIIISANSLAGLTSNYNVVMSRFNTGGSNLSLTQWQSNTSQDLNSIVATPVQLFVNVAANDYHLLSTAAAINSGVASFNGKTAPTVDLDGKSRPQGTAYDIGSYEFVLPVTTPSVTINSPAQNATVPSGVLTVNFTSSVPSGDQGQTHVRFYMDNDTTPYNYFNGGTREVLYNGLHTHFVHHGGNGTQDALEFHGLSSGTHQIRLEIVDGSGQVISDPLSPTVLNFTVSTPPTGVFNLQPVMTGLTFGVTGEFATDGRMFYTVLFTGEIRTITPGFSSQTTFAIVPNLVTGGEQGLLGLTLDPDFANNHFVYVYYTSTSGNRVMRYTDVNSMGTNPTVIIGSIPNASNHNGGKIKFGPDGKLYITTGDAENGGNSQNINSPAGKILRINKDGTIPADNPFPNSPTWSLGHRNVFGLTFHPHTGDLWITENGPASDDEVNRIVKGGNYGWPTVTGITTNTNFINPLVEITPTIAPTGMIAVREGSPYGLEYDNNLFFADFNEGKVRRIVLTGAGLAELSSMTIGYNGGLGGLLGLIQGLDGYIYVTNTSGGLHRLVLTSADITPPVISAIQTSNITATGATITWTTNEASDTQVEYGLTTAYGNSTTLNTEMVISHNQTLSGLIVNTTYHYRVKSKDASGNMQISADFTFQTSLPSIPPQVSPVAHWKFDETSGTTASNAIDPSNPGTLVDGPTFTPAVFNNGLTFDGVDDRMTHNRPLSNAGTIAHWLNPSLLRPMVAYYQSNGTVAGAFNGFLDSLPGGNGNEIQTGLDITGTKAAFYYQDGTTAFKLISSTNLTAGQWVHVAATWDESGTAYLFVNGQQVASAVMAGTTFGNFTPTVMQVGRVGDGTAARHLYGLVDELHIYNRALTATEIAVLAQPVVDTTPPTVSNVASSNVTSTGATINWMTNERSTSRVEYGLTTTYGNLTILDNALVTSHSQTLAGLNPNTLYHYRVISRDAAGNETISQDFTFTTQFAPLPDTTSPTISAVTPSNITSTGATINWATNEASDSVVEYGATTSYGSSSPSSTSLVMSHSINLSGLTAGTPYHYRVKSRDAAGNLATSTDFTFTTQAPLAGLLVEIGKTGSPYQKLGDVNWQSLQPGTVVRIYWKPTPYRERLLLDNKDLTIEGVAGPNGELPIIDLTNSTTHSQFSRFNLTWRQDLGVVYIGAHESYPDTQPTNIVIRNLEIRGGRPNNPFTDAGGVTRPGTDVGLYIKGVKNITVEGMIFRNNATALFSSSQHEREITENLTLRGSYFVNNGVTDSYKYHSIYTEGTGTTLVEYNHFGPKVAGDQGSQAKFRDIAKVIFRYNYVESPSAHMLDLVNPESDALKPLQNLVPPYGVDYHQPLVYGNIFFRMGNLGAGPLFDFGGDSQGKSPFPPGAFPPTYRQGPLSFYDNTVVILSNQGGSEADSWRQGIFILTGDVQTVNAYNNIFYGAARTPGSNPSEMYLMMGTGRLNLTNNWASPNIQDIYGSSGAVVVRTNVVTNTANDPGFVNLAAGDLHLRSDAQVRSLSLPLPAELAAYPVLFEYAGNLSGIPRAAIDDYGAFDFVPPSTGDTTPPTVSNIQATGITASGATATWNTNEAFDTRLRYRVSGTTTWTTLPTNTSMVTAHSVTLSGLTAATAYQFEVASQDAAGNLSPWFATNNFTTLTLPDTTAPVVAAITTPGTVDQDPAAPGLQVNLGSTVTYHSSATNASSFTWKWFYTINGGARIQYSAGTGPNINDVVFTYGSTLIAYQWIIQVNGAVNNVNEQTLLVEVKDYTPPVISAVTLSNVTSNSASINWNTNEASDTQVEYGLTTAYGNSTTLNSAMVTSHSVNLTGFVANTLYYYRVKSKDAAGNLATSNDFTFTTASVLDTTPPSTPTGLSATAISSSQINLSWTASADNIGVTGYKIFRAGTQIAISATTAYSDTGLAASTNYLYTVSAYDAANNNSAQSISASSTTQAPLDTTSPLISSISTSFVTSNSATITWTTNEASDSQVEYGTTTGYGSSTTINNFLTTSHSQALSSFSPSTLYHYRVKSKDAAGNLAISLDFTFTTLATPDIIPPLVSIISPNDTSNVSGTVTVSATASDNLGVAGVQFKLDGINLGTEDTISPFSVQWNTSSITNGSHSLTAIARDAVGNSTTSSVIIVSVNNAVPDLQPPTISITNPSNNARVNGTILITATASDNVRVAGVQSKIDGVNLGAEDTVIPYEFSWDTTTVANGLHTLTALARDAASNATTSSIINFIVNNVAPAVNQAPVVSPGLNQSVNLPAHANLNGTATDDDLPQSSTFSKTWSKSSGPGIVSFGNANAFVTTASFSQAGTYVLTLTVSDGILSGTGDITITVNPQNTTITATLSAVPTSVTKGQSVVLLYSTSGATNSSIDQNIGVVSTNGSTTVNPVQTTTYTLTAVDTSSGKSATSQVTVIVTAPTTGGGGGGGGGGGSSGTTPPTASISANYTKVTPGATVTLSYATTGASSVSISPLIGSVSGSGSIAVTPLRTTTYTINANNASGVTVTAEVTVTVANTTFIDTKSLDLSLLSNDFSSIQQTVKSWGSQKPTTSQLQDVLQRLQTLAAKLSNYQSEVSQTPTSSTSKTAEPYIFPRYLGYSDRGDDVLQLQNLLIKLGYMRAVATGYYGPITRAAIRTYQLNHNISPATGNVGPLTKASLNTGK